MNKLHKMLCIELDPGALAHFRWLLMILVNDNVTPKEKALACKECQPEIRAVLDVLLEQENITWIKPKVWHPTKTDTPKTT